MLQPDQIDINTINVSMDAPVRELLEDAGQAARIYATVNKCYVTVSHIETDGEINLKVRSEQVSTFEKGYFLCPRAADIEYEAQTKSVRPLPSMLATPSGDLIVSKPSLCDSCTFRLYKAVTGNCDGRPYTLLNS